MASSAAEPVAGERAGLRQSLARHRHFLRCTTRGLTDEQAARRAAASELPLSGLIKHVALTGRQCMRLIIDAPAAMSWDEASAGDWMAGFKMLDGQTLAGAPAPWFEAGALWPARRMLLPVIAETAHHAGHAGIIRESVDGAKSTG